MNCNLFIIGFGSMCLIYCLGRSNYGAYGSHTEENIYPFFCTIRFDYQFMDKVLTSIQNSLKPLNSLVICSFDINEINPSGWEFSLKRYSKINIYSSGDVSETLRLWEQQIDTMSPVIDWVDYAKITVNCPPAPMYRTIGEQLEDQENPTSLYCYKQMSEIEAKLTKLKPWSSRKNKKIQYQHFGNSRFSVYKICFGIDGFITGVKYFSK